MSEWANPVTSWGGGLGVPVTQRPATFNVMGARPGATQTARGPGVPDFFAGRLRSILSNPGAINSDPAFQFLRDQGEQALARSAGAKRMRFAGKTMQDFTDYGQQASSQYLAQLVQMLQGGAQTEAQQYDMRLADADRNMKAAADAANREDPYGILRRAASTYGNADEYAKDWSRGSNAESVNVLRDRWMKGRRLLDSMGG